MNANNQHPFNQAIYHRETRPCDTQETQRISEFFYQQLHQKNNINIKKTHFFNDRYENIYLKATQFLPLQQFEKQAKVIAAKLLNCSASELSMDYWFNDMPPSHITDWHRHDVMDEQLSAVYYLKIPPTSGNLLLKQEQTIHTIIPKENDFVFFQPNVNHFVEKNQSNDSRLSIGMNFGFIKNKV